MKVVRPIPTSFVLGVTVEVGVAWVLRVATASCRGSTRGIEGQLEGSDMQREEIY